MAAPRMSVACQAFSGTLCSTFTHQAELGTLRSNIVDVVLQQRQQPPFQTSQDHQRFASGNEMSAGVNGSVGEGKQPGRAIGVDPALHEEIDGNYAPFDELGQSEDFTGRSIVPQETRAQYNSLPEDNPLELDGLDDLLDLADEMGNA